MTKELILSVIYYLPAVITFFLIVYLEKRFPNLMTKENKKLKDDLSNVIRENAELKEQIKKFVKQGEELLEDVKVELDKLENKLEEGEEDVKDNE